MLTYSGMYGQAGSDRVKVSASGRQAINQGAERESHSFSCAFVMRVFDNALSTQRYAIFVSTSDDASYLFDKAAPIR